MIDQLFGSKTRVQLLGLFLNNPERAFYVREITREVGGQINSVRRELANLVRIGIIKSSNKDNKVYYEADQGWRFFVQLSGIFADNVKKADDTKVSIKAWAAKFSKIGDVRVVIFAGKLVYGSESKIDLLVAGDDISPVKFSNTVKALEKDSGVNLNYSKLTFNDFYYRMSVRDAFAMDVIHAKNEIVIDSDDLLSGDINHKEEGIY